MGVLVGIAFALFYSVMGLPLGRLADLWSRTRIITLCIGVWGLMTVASGLAENYWQLLIARMGVAIGEAGLVPAAWPLISEYFSAGGRARALSFFQIGGFSGSGLAFIIGAAVIGSVSLEGSVALPFIGHLQPWRQVLILVGLGTILFVLPTLTIKEPDRRARPNTQSNVSEKKAEQSIRSLISYLRKRWQLYFFFNVGMGLLLLTLTTAAVWVPTFFIRYHGLTVEKTGYLYGMITLLAAVPGVYIGGWLADKLSSRGVRNAYLKVILAGTILMTPFIIIAPFYSSYVPALLSFAIFLFFNGMTNGVAVTYIQSVTPLPVRGQISAIYTISLNIIAFSGASLLPIIAGAISTGNEGLGIALSLLCGAAGLGAAFIFTFKWRTFETALKSV